MCELLNSQLLTETAEPMNRKEKIVKLILEMSQALPAPVRMMLTTYQSMVHRFVDELTDEQIEEILDKAQSIIDEIRG